MFGAVDIGGTKIAVGIGEESGKIVAQDHVPTHDVIRPDAACDWMAKTLERLCQSAGLSTGEMNAVGVGSPGPFRDGKLVRPSNLPEWDGVDLTGELQKRLNLPVSVQNDASAATLGEWMFGSGRGCANMAYVTVSTGVGSGLVLNGQPYWGGSGNAGELGHVIVDPDGVPCRAGHRGCLETVASGTAIARMGEERKQESAILSRAGTVGAEAVFSAWHQGDAVAAEIVETAARALGLGLSWLIDLADPERIVLGGGVMQEGQRFLDRILPYVKTFAMPVMADSVKFLLADNAEDAGLRGSLAVAVYRAQRG